MSEARHERKELIPSVSSAPYGLTVQQACWLAYRLGELPHTSGILSNGRDVMRIIHFRWAQLDLPKEGLARFESDIVKDDYPPTMTNVETWRRAIRALAGDCPMCDTSEIY